MQLDPDLARYVLLVDFQVGRELAMQRRKPLAVVDHVGVGVGDVMLEPLLVLGKRELFQLPVRTVQNFGGGSLVDFT